jgi:hypothetical protein
VPGSQSTALLLGEGTGTGDIVLTPISHLDVLGDVVLVGDFGIALDHCKLLLVLAGGDCGEVAALDLLLVKSVEEGEGDVLVLFVVEGPVDPLLILDFEIFEQAQVYFHC